jgi:hypothetical protein
VENTSRLDGKLIGKIVQRVRPAVGLIGVSQRLPDWALFAPWFTLLGLQPFIIKGLAVRLRHRRWRASKVVVQLPASVAAAHSCATQPNAEREAA